LDGDGTDDGVCVDVTIGYFQGVLQGIQMGDDVCGFGAPAEEVQHRLGGVVVCICYFFSHNQSSATTHVNEGRKYQDHRIHSQGRVLAVVKFVHRRIALPPGVFSRCGRGKTDESRTR